MAWKNFNLNPEGLDSGDCVVRAVGLATGDGWEETYVALCILGLRRCDWGNSDAVWHEYLMEKGWKRHFLRHDCPICYTVEDFCREYPEGTYILGIEGHVVCVRDSNYYDTWDSGRKRPIYYWTKEE